MMLFVLNIGKPYLYPKTLLFHLILGFAVDEAPRQGEDLCHSTDKGFFERYE